MGSFSVEINDAPIQFSLAGKPNLQICPAFTCHLLAAIYQWQADPRGSYLFQWQAGRENLKGCRERIDGRAGTVWPIKSQ